MRLITVLIFLIVLSSKNYLLGNDDGPTKMYVGYYIESMHVNYSDQSADLRFYFWMRADLNKGDTAISEFKNIAFLNCKIDKLEIHEELLVGQTFYLSGLVECVSKFQADYRAYPFDRQKIPIVIEHLTLTNDELLLFADYGSYDSTLLDTWGIYDFLNTDDMIIEKTKFNTNNRVYKTNFGDPRINEKASKYSSLEYHIYIKRNFTPYVVKFLIPLIIVLILAYLVFYIPAAQLELASSLTVTSLIAAIAFQWTISDDLPEVGYLTKVDKVYYLGYFLIMSAMVQTIYTYNLEQRGKIKFATTLELLGKVLFPVIFVLGLLYFIFN